MRRAGFRAGLSTVALVAFVSLARADAPPDQYMLFSSVDPTIIDNYTGLIWQRAAPDTMISFDAAASYCQGLSLNGYVANWRVPSYKELLTLVDENPHVEYSSGQLFQHAIDPNAFPQTAVDTPYWTSSLYPADPTRKAYVVDFQDGQASYDLFTQPHHVRCVHD
ncbi:MAG TPA: DUF1566 domain-containing protein [Polyangiaceae bacterium]